ncbi:MAG: hypothetical protein NT053_11880 [Cyanobacteria bacterium]|jgi:hypothetical protein|nr:hypothetical protein [Cyanobacteriota bacterium]
MAMASPLLMRPADPVRIGVQVSLEHVPAQHLFQRLGHPADTDGTHHPPGPAFLSDSVAVGQHRQIGAVIGELQEELRS